MEVRVLSILILLVALTAVHGSGSYVVKKVMKVAPQYQPYSVKSHGKNQHPNLHCLVWSSDVFVH
jgi:hypothetical protein